MRKIEQLLALAGDMRRFEEETGVLAENRDELTVEELDLLNAAAGRPAGWAAQKEAEQNLTGK